MDTNTAVTVNIATLTNETPDSRIPQVDWLDIWPAITMAQCMGSRVAMCQAPGGDYRAERRSERGDDGVTRSTDLVDITLPAKHCRHPRSCAKCEAGAEPCGRHIVGTGGHERCTGR